MARSLVLAATAVCALAFSLVAAPAPAHARALETILQDDAQLLHRPEDQVRASLEEMRRLGVDRVRITAGWSVLTRDPDAAVRPPFDATNPASYEQDRFKALDRAVVLAQQYGFKVMLDVAFWAPKWASHDAPGDRGRTDVDPQAFRDFAVAVARRYSGGFIIPHAATASAGTLTPPPLPGNDERALDEQFGDSNDDAASTFHDTLPASWLGPLRGGSLDAYLGTVSSPATKPLPRVDVFTLWNEPNHTAFLRPQWERYGRVWIPHSPQVYRSMVTLAYPAMKAVRPDATVLIGATAGEGSYSDDGTGSVAPLRFLRELACVNSDYRPLRRSGCANFKQVPGDGWAHHPYSLDTTPGEHASPDHPDDVPIADLPKLAHALDKLVDMGRLAPGLRNIWITEYGYETNPPVSGWKFGLGDQAEFLTWAEYLAWRLPQVHSFAQFLLRDLPGQAFASGGHRLYGQWESGLLQSDGTQKLAPTTFRAGLFAERLSARRLRFWGRLRLAPGPHMVMIESRRPGARTWEPIRTRGIGQKAKTVQFVADGRDSFERFATARPPSTRRYRLRYVENGQWQPPVGPRADDAPSFRAQPRQT